MESFGGEQTKTHSIFVGQELRVHTSGASWGADLASLVCPRLPRMLIGLGTWTLFLGHMG